MRILHVTDTFRPQDSALDGQVDALARQQRARGHDVRILTLTSPTNTSDPDDDLAVTRSTMTRTRALMSVRHLRAMAAGSVTADVDIVHAHFAVSSPLAITAARMANRREVPLAVTVHSLWPAKPVLRLANLPYWNAAVRGAWSAVSTTSAASVRRCLERDTDVLVVPNFVDTGWWTRSAAGPRDGIHLVTVAGKGTNRLIKVLAELGPASAVRLSVVGQPDQHQIAGVGSVSLLGTLSPADFRDLLHSADVYVAPGRREAFDTRALQARASGLPVIGLRGVGLGDFIEDGREGVLVTDDTELAHTVAALSGNRGDLDRWRAITTSRRPSVTGDDALRAVDELYDRARRNTGMRTPAPVRVARPAANKIFLPRGLPQAPSAAASVRSFAGCP